MFLVCDSESSGLPKYSVAADDPSQPRLVEISAVLLDFDGKEIDRLHHIIKPIDWPLEDEAFVKNMQDAEAIHGISLEKMKAEGVPLMIAHDDWERLYSRCQYLVGYNIWHDWKVIRGEWRRIGQTVPFRDRQGICMMKAARKVLGGRNPKLSVAVEKILGREHNFAHRSDADLAATIDLFHALGQRGQVEIDDQPESKQPKELAA